eukprot:scaffold3701_cov149-Amphora_coffeaeformis.AAC.4
MDVSALLEDPASLIGPALVAVLVIYLVSQLLAAEQRPDATKETTSRSVPPSTASSSSSSSKKKNKKKKAAKAEPVVPEPAPAPPAAAPTTNGKSKKKKNKKGGGSATTAEAVEETKPSEAPVQEEVKPVPEPTPAPAPAAGGKKSKKKKNKKGSGAPASAAPEPAVTPAEADEDDSDDDDDLALAMFAKGGRAADTKKQEAKKPAATSGGVNEWTTVPKKSKTGTIEPLVTTTTEGDAESTTATEVMELEKDKVPLVIGPKGATIQQIQGQTGAKLDVNKTYYTVTVTGTPTQVFAAVRQVQSLLDASSQQSAHTVTLTAADINGSEGVKAIIGRGGAQIQKIQALCPEARIQANIDTGTVVITGPTDAVVKAAAQHCKNAVFGETSVTIELGSRAMVMAVCGRNFSDLQQYQKDTATRMDVTGTSLTIRGDVDKVQQAKVLMEQKVALYQGITMPVPSGQIGAIIGQGGANLRKIQDRSGAQVEVNQVGDAAECKIIGTPKAVEEARIMVEKTLSGEVELKPGEGLVEVNLGVGAPAVIGRGGSNIADLEKKYGVKLNVQNAVCKIIGKKEKLPAAQTAIEAIVTPLIQKAAEEEKIRKQAEALAVNGDTAWSMPQDDELAGW